jgi:arylsulfatase A-like enzyme
VELPVAETLLPEVLRADGYATGAFGKWHLASRVGSGLTHPNDQGFETFVGTMGNLTRIDSVDGLYQDYDDWEAIRDGAPERVSDYATSWVVDEALDWVRHVQEPWFMWLALHSPHAPFHMPPEHLVTDATRGGIRQQYQQMLEAADAELGRFLAGLGPDMLAETIVLVVGDNGSPGQVTTTPFDASRAKGTVYEGGIGVPVLLSGGGLPALGEQGSLVSLVDIFATVTDITGTPLSPEVRDALDSVSLAPVLVDSVRPGVRHVTYSESFTPNGIPVAGSWQRTIRDRSYKLIRWEDGSESLYDLRGSRLEGADLLEQGALSAEAWAHWAELSGRLDMDRLR